MNGANSKISSQLERQAKYQYGFVTDIASDSLLPGLSEATVRWIAQRKQEPPFMLAWRLEAFAAWQQMTQPSWGKLQLAPIDFQAISYFSAPVTPGRAGKVDNNPNASVLSQLDPQLLVTYQKLGIPLQEQEQLARMELGYGSANDRAASKNVAVDAVFDSVSVATTFKTQLEQAGVIFCPISEAIVRYPELIQRYLGSVVSNRDNFFAALNAAVFSDGSFVYVPPGVRCPMELSTYFRINAARTGQFERTLIVADRDSYVSYLEGCTAPIRDEHQLHAAVVELVALEGAEIKYSTVQNWYPGDEQGRGGIYNMVTKRGECRGANSHISWTQLETGSAVTWKYPSTILRGDNSRSEFYSVAITNHYQQADTGSKMIHLGRNTRSLIISKGISAGHSSNSYRGLVEMTSGAAGGFNYSQCDSLLIGPHSAAHTYPQVVNHNTKAVTEHEATTSRVSADHLFYCQQRGLTAEQSLGLIVNGFCQQIFKQLPMEFVVEAYKLVEVTLEGVYQC